MRYSATSEEYGFSDQESKYLSSYSVYDAYSDGNYKNYAGLATDKSLSFTNIFLICEFEQKMVM